MWQYTGAERPPFAEVPEAGQESVWDYPRPPQLDWCDAHVEVKHNDELIAHTERVLRVLETASPPTVYIPAESIAMEQLRAVPGASMCEWKGRASYFARVADDQHTPIAWWYPNPRPAFAALKGFVSFYPGRIECTLDGERVKPQPGHFYGGWMTASIAGPVKGEPGTQHW